MQESNEIGKDAPVKLSRWGNQIEPEDADTALTKVSRNDPNR